MVFDFLTYRIPNTVVCGVGLTALLYAFAHTTPSTNFWALLGWREALIVLFVGFVLFVCKIVGAGDVKLLAAVLLWLPGSAWAFLWSMSFFGGVLAIFLVVQAFYLRKPVALMPYGLAIGGTGLVFLWERVHMPLI